MMFLMEITLLSFVIPVGSALHDSRKPVCQTSEGFSWVILRFMGHFNNSTLG